MVVAGSWGRGDGELMFNGCRVSAQEYKNVLGMDGGDGCTTMWKHLLQLNGIATNGSDGKLYVRCISLQ